MTIPDKTYNERLANRLREIMNILGMTVAGFAEFIGRDSSHIYGILNLTRSFSHALAEDIGKKLNVNGSKILNLNVPVSQSIAKTESVHEFKKDKRNNPEYFSSTLTDRSIDLFISRILIKSPFLKEPRYLKEIELYVCSEYKKVFTNDQLSKALRYSVKKGILKSDKRPIKLKSGDLGKRLVDVYWVG